MHCDNNAGIILLTIIGSIDGGWDAARSDIAKKYLDGGYPEMATFIESSTVADSI